MNAYSDTFDILRVSTAEILFHYMIFIMFSERI